MDSFQLRMTKSFLRKQLRITLKKIGALDRKRKSRKIIVRVSKLPAFKKAGSIFTYVALPNEVETHGLIRQALTMKKNVYAPRMNRRSREITFFQIRNFPKDLRKGMFGIPEPRPIASRRGSPQASDLVIVPALGFDRTGRRIGRGGGYFDRFLRKAKRATKIGLAFREQVVKKIPQGSNDVCVDCVITD